MVLQVVTDFMDYFLEPVVSIAEDSKGLRSFKFSKKSSFKSPLSFSAASGPSVMAM